MFTMAMRLYHAPNQVYQPITNASQLTPAGLKRAEQNYRIAMRFIGPAQQKLMWPSMIGGLFDPSMFGPKLASGVSQFAPSLVPTMDLLSRTIGGASILLPRMLSDVYRSVRMPYERHFRQQLGSVGKISSLMTAFSLLNAPGSYARALSMMLGRMDIARRIPRLENFLTGTGINRILGKGGEAVEGGGVLSAGYRGLKRTADALAGGKLSELAGAKTGVAGVAGAGLGLLDKGISSLLASPTGVSLGLAAISVVASIRKSMKLARLQPTQKPPDKFARKFYAPSPTSSSVRKVLSLAQRGVDPQTLTFMLMQIQISEMQQLNMQVAGFRGEYQSEIDFRKQQHEKGTEAFEKGYSKDILGEDDRGYISKLFDKMEYGVLRLQEYNPIYQVSKTVIDLLTGKGFRTSRARIEELKKFYGYEETSKEMKEKAEEFGVALDQTRLIHTPSRSISDLADSLESKKLAFLSATYDVNRYMLAELMTIRMSGFGIGQSILYRKEPGIFKQFISDMFDTLNPANLPGINAIVNLTKSAFSFTKGLITAPHKIFELGLQALRKSRDFLLGQNYKMLSDPEEWSKAAGLYIPSQDKAFDYLANGLPDKLEQIRAVLYDIYYANEEMVRQMGGEVTKEAERLVWSPTEKRYITKEAAIALEKSQKIELLTTKAKAFREGPLGKLLFLADLLTTNLFKKGAIDEAASVVSDIRRMGRVERRIGGIEIGITGEPETFESKRQLKSILGEISSIKSKLATATTSIQEIKSEELLRRVPSSVGWWAGAGLTSLTAILGLLLAGPIGAGVIGGSALAAFLKARQAREKEIKTLREEEVENRNLLERIIEIQEEYFKKPYEQRLAETSVRKGPGEVETRKHILTLNEQMTDYLRAIAVNTEMMIDAKFGYLPKITSYLGDEKGSVYELLEPGQRVAEVTIVDKDAKPIIFPPAAPSLLPPPAVSNNVIPFPSRAAVGGGVIPSGEPVLVGEKGPEILIPDTPGLVVPHEHIKEIKAYGEGGVLSQAPGDYGIFSKIYEVLREMFLISKESLGISREQAVKEEKDRHEQTIGEKLVGLKQRLNEKQESIWKRDVVDLLRGILKKPISDAKTKISEKATTFWDWLSDLFKNADFWKSILAGLGLVGLGTVVWKLTGELSELNKWLKDHGMSTIEQLKLAGRGILGAGMVIGGAPYGKLPSWKSRLKGGADVGAGDWTKLGALEEVPVGEVKAAGEVAAKEGILTKIGKSARAKLATAGEFVGGVGSKIRSITGVGPTVSETITFIEQAASKILEPIGKVISFMGEAFSPLLKLLEPLAKVVGRIALPLQIVLTSFDFISDTIQGYKEGGLAGAVKGFFFGKMKDDMETTLGQVGKWAGLGMIAGFPFGGFVGSLAGGLLGAALGATISAVKGAFASYQEGGLWEAIKTFLMGEKEGGLLSAFKTMGPYALAGAVAGFPFGGPIGSLVGGSIGVVIGGLIGWIGQYTLTDFVSAMAEWGPNQFIIDNLFTGEGLVFATKFAEYGSVIPIVGPLVGGILGSAVDLSIYAFKGILSIFGTVSGWLAEANNYIISGQAKGSYAETFAQYGAFTVPIIGPVLGAMAGSLVDFGLLAVKGISQLPTTVVNWIKQNFPRVAALLFPESTGTTGGLPISASEAELGVANVDYGGTTTTTSKPIGGVVARHQKELESRYKILTLKEAKQAGATSKVAAAQGAPVTSEQVVAETPTSTSSKESPTFPDSGSQNVGKILQEASAATGAPLGTMVKIAEVESGLDPNRKAKSPSTASGLFQFITSTWKKITSSKGGKYGITPETSPFNARANALMGGELIRENREAIAGSTLTSPPNDADVYAAHFFGVSAAKQFFRELKKNPDTIAADVFPKEAKSNPSIFYKDKACTQPRTVGEVYRVFAQKMAVDPSAVLYRAGKGLTTRERIGEVEYKVGEKAKDILSILTEAFDKIKEAFIDAFNKQFTNVGLQKTPKVEDISLKAEQQTAQATKAISDAKAREYAGLSSEMEESDKPCSDINEFVRKRVPFILNNKDFQNYYNTHLIATKDGKGVKLSPEDIRTAAETIARSEFAAGVNVPGSIYKFNPETAPFRQFLYDSTKGEGKEVLADYDETAEDIRKRAEAASKAQLSEEEKKLREAAKQTGGVPAQGGVVAALTPQAPPGGATAPVVPSPLTTLPPGELEKFKAMSDMEKVEYLRKNYPPGKPIPIPLREEAKRLGVLTRVAGPAKIGEVVSVETRGSQAASTGGVVAALTPQTPLAPEKQVEAENKAFVEKYMKGAEEAARKGMTLEEYNAQYSKEDLDKFRMWSGGTEAVRLAEIFDNAGGTPDVVKAVSPKAPPSVDVPTGGISRAFASLAGTGKLAELGAGEVKWKKELDEVTSKGLGTLRDPSAIKESVQSMIKEIAELPKTAEAEKELEKSMRAKDIEERLDRVRSDVEEQRKKIIADKVASMPPKSIEVTRNQYGTEITPAFSLLEKEIFGSLDAALIGGITNYPFESKMRHSI